jgi:hypothetical protein
MKGRTNKTLPLVQCIYSPLKCSPTAYVPILQDLPEMNQIPYIQPGVIFPQASHLEDKVCVIPVLNFDSEFPQHVPFLILGKIVEFPEEESGPMGSVGFLVERRGRVRWRRRKSE